jgi:hypothetical protein
MIGVWGGSPPGDCAIREAQWLHFLRFLKQIRKIIALTFLTIRYFAKAILWIERAPLPPLPLLVKGSGGGCPSCSPPPQFRHPCRSCSILVSVVPVISDSCSGRSGGFVPVVSGFSTCLLYVQILGATSCKSKNKSSIVVHFNRLTNELVPTTS